MVLFLGLATVMIIIKHDLVLCFIYPLFQQKGFISSRTDCVIL